MRNNESKKLVIRGEKSNRSSLSSLYDAADYSQKRREEIDRSTLSVYNLQSTDDNKESKMLKDDRKPATDQQLLSTDATIYQDAQRCSKITESLHQINKWINGSTDQQTFGSTGQQ